MHKFLGYLLTPLYYFAFGALLGIFHPVQWLSLKLGGYRAHKRAVDLLNFFLTQTYVILGCRVHFRSRSSLPLDRPLIFIANHQSMYDISPLIWHLRKYHAKFISKIELTRRIPSISFNLKYGGGANIDRQDPKQSITEILQLAKRMNENTWSAIIFPEGTRSKNGRLKDFAVGGIATLLKKIPKALVVPIAIDGSWNLTRYGNFPLSVGEKIAFTVLPPIEPAEKPAEIVVEEAKSAISSVLQ